MHSQDGGSGNSINQLHLRRQSIAGSLRPSVIDLVPNAACIGHGFGTIHVGVGEEEGARVVGTTRAATSEWEWRR